MYLYMTTAIPMAIAANKTDVMSIIERHNVNPMNERILSIVEKITIIKKERESGGKCINK
jgi:hypothetical protein